MTPDEVASSQLTWRESTYVYAVAPESSNTVATLLVSKNAVTLGRCFGGMRCGLFNVWLRVVELGPDRTDEKYRKI
jgi:hypothetical protein